MPGTVANTGKRLGTVPVSFQGGFCMAKKILNGIYRILSVISGIVNKICIVLSALIGAAMVFCIVYGVFTRYVLGSQAIWTEEISRFLMVWLAFIGCSVAWYKGNMTRVTFVQSRLPETGQKILDAVCTVIVLIYLIFFIQSGNAALLIFKLQKESITKISMIYPAMGLYVGAVAMIIHSVPRLIGQIMEICRALSAGKEGR